MKFGPKNRERGEGFEKVFEKIASFQQILTVKNWISARYCYFKGKMVLKAVHGDLDYKLINKSGRVAYIDCKCFEKAKFTYSQLKEHQIERAVMYNDWSVPAGFVVMFSNLNRVSFYSGHMIKNKGPRSSFRPEDGISLGTMTNCDLRLIFEGRGLIREQLLASPT